MSAKKDEQHLLRIKELSWIPKYQNNVGVVVDDRYYILNEMHPTQYWLCWDMLKKQDVLIRPKKAVNESNNYNNRTQDKLIKYPVNLGDLLNDRYYVLKMLCCGEFSLVWLCWDLQERRDVAIKIQKPIQMSMMMAKNAIPLLREIHERQPMDPRHERIVQILDEFELIDPQGNKLCCNVLELMEGDLLFYLKSFKLYAIPLEIVKSITRQLLEGLDYLHSCCGIIHTDIKLENVLWQRKAYNCNAPDVNIKLSDFGQACGKDEKHYRDIQTPAYRSLEVLLDTGYDTSVDIWSLACLVFELATGEYLFSAYATYWWCRNEAHIAAIIELLGPIPAEIIQKGTFGNEYFNCHNELRHITNLRPRSLVNLLIKQFDWSKPEAVAFAAFLKPMLKYDTTKRATAAECLQHPWLTSNQF